MCLQQGDERNDRITSIIAAECEENLRWLFQRLKGRKAWTSLSTRLTEVCRKGHERLARFVSFEGNVKLFCIEPTLKHEARRRGPTDVVVVGPTERPLRRHYSRKVSHFYDFINILYIHTYVRISSAIAVYRARCIAGARERAFLFPLEPFPLEDRARFLALLAAPSRRAQRHSAATLSHASRARASFFSVLFHSNVK